MTIRLDQQVAIITGAGRGLGRAYALELARRGARVVVNDAGIDLAGGSREALSPAEAVVAEIVAAGGEAIADAGDVTRAADVRAMVAAAIEKWGRLDIVVSNAGNMRKLVFSETSEDDLASHLLVHVHGSFLLARAAWPHLLERGYGRIVMTTSQVGLYGQRDAAAYGAAKMGVLGLMHGMKLEADGTGIQINCIAPFALTRMAEGTFPEAMRPFIVPESVAPALAWLASPACPLHGEVLIAGGGHFALARSIESRGIDIDDPAMLSAEAIGDALGTLADYAGAPHYPDALGAVGGTFDRLAKLAAG